MHRQFFVYLSLRRHFLCFSSRKCIVLHCPPHFFYEYAGPRNKKSWEPLLYMQPVVLRPDPSFPRVRSSPFPAPPLRRLLPTARARPSQSSNLNAFPSSSHAFYLTKQFPTKRFRWSNPRKDSSPRYRLPSNFLTPES